MASLYILWNIKEKRVEGIFEQSADATAAKRRVSAKSGTHFHGTSGKSALDAADLEVLTATKP
jgi:hypothetical protein